MDESGEKAPLVIHLSSFSKALIESLNAIKSKRQPDESSRLSVSQTVSFFAIAYEKIRNAIEYREGHLIRRAAIERILKRRLALNPEGAGEGENLLRELMWARYFPNESLGGDDITDVQKILNTYLQIREKVLEGKHEKQKLYYAQFLFDLLTCAVEEVLSPKEAKENATFTFFIYQVLKDKVKIERVAEEEKNAYFYVTLEKNFAKSDLSYLRYHLFSLFHEPIFNVLESKLTPVIDELPELFHRVDTLIRNPYADRLRRFVKNQIPPFSILFELFKKNGTATEGILQDPNRLWTEVQQICSLKYAQSRSRLNGLAIKAIIYIFLTKMLFILILEYPLSLALYNEVSYVSLAINSLFPPFLMFIIIWLTTIPGEENTQRIYTRIVDIIDADKSFETSISFITRKAKTRRPVLVFVFTIFYGFTFILTFYLLHLLLNILRFNLVSQVIFLFFISIVSFFAYRIRNVAKEYQLKERESFFRPFVDFFFLPIISVGKFLSRGIAKLNFFGVIFDFLIEAPFKLIIDVIEEWISFIRSKREEII